MKVTLANATNLLLGRGGERSIYFYCKYKPAGVEVTVLQNDILDVQRMPQEYIDEIYGKCKVITVKSHARQQFPKNNLYYAYRALIEKPEFKDLESTDKDTLKEIRDTDLAYLLNNNYAIFFSGLV